MGTVDMVLPGGRSMKWPTAQLFEVKMKDIRPVKVGIWLRPNGQQ